jgi:hypothetical protein
MNVAADLDELRETLDKAQKRSPWTIYLRKNYPAFRDTIAGQPADWEAIAGWAERHSGGPIKPATARKAFERERVRRGEGKPKKVAAVTTVKPDREPTRGVRIFSPAEPAPAPALTSPENVDGQVADVLNRLKKKKRWLLGEDDPEPAEVAAKAEPTATYAKSRMEEVMKSMEEAGRFTRPSG